MKTFSVKQIAIMAGAVGVVIFVSAYFQTLKDLVKIPDSKKE